MRGDALDPEQCGKCGRWMALRTAGEREESQVWRACARCEPEPEGSGS